MNSEIPRCTGIVFPLTRDDFHKEHPCYYKPVNEYFGTYVRSILYALQNLGIPIKKPEKPRGYLIDWEFEDGKVVTMGIDYSDYPDYTPFDYLDGIMKMKYHPARYSKEERTKYARYGTFPGGFCFAVGGGGIDTRPFLKNEIPRFREIRDKDKPIDQIYTRMAFRLFAVPLENRVTFREYFKDGGFGGAVPHQQYVFELSRYKWILNVCGNGWSIDRKVVEACAVGAAIISDRGLEDLLLPWNERFVHGENIWFVDSPEEAVEATKNITDAQWRKLVEGSRRIFDGCFHPESMSRWYLKCAQQLYLSRYSSLPQIYESH